MKKEVGGVWLAWEESGHGLPVVLLHAFPLDRRMWEPQRCALAGRYRVITPDFRGFGESPPAEGDAAMEALARDVGGILGAIGCERVVLGGLSMGGYVAFAFCRLFPERVAALLLADTRASADTDEGRKSRYEMAALAEREGSGPIAERMLPKLLAPSTHEGQPEVVAAVRAMILSAFPAGIAAASRGIAARAAAFDLLPQLRCPTLVLVGEHDSLTPPADAEALAKAIPGAELATIPSAGHLSNLEQPDRFNQLLLDFLARL